MHLNAVITTIVVRILILAIVRKIDFLMTDFWSVSLNCLFIFFNMATRACKTDKVMFCYICGKYFGKHRAYPIKDNYQLQSSFEQYLGLKLSQDIDKKWASSCVCSGCQATLTHWANDKPKYFSFSVPRVWREPQSHASGWCYFCSVVLRCGRQKTVYPSLPSSIAPVLRSDSPPPQPLSKRIFLSNSENSSCNNKDE